MTSLPSPTTSFPFTKRLMPVPPPVLVSSPGCSWPPPFAVSFELLMLTSSLADMPEPPPPTPPVAVTVASTRSSFPVLAHMPKDPPLVPEPPVVDREEPSLPWIVSLPLPDVIFLSSHNRRCCRRSAHSCPPAPASHRHVPETVTASWADSPASTFRLRRMTVRGLAELLMIFTTLRAASCAFSVRVVGALVVLVGLLLSGPFISSVSCSAAGLAAGFAASCWASGSYWPYSIT